MPLRVLVAEDEQITLEHLLYILGKEGYTATGVSNGTEAWAKLAEHDFDVLITDIKMPGMTGIELLHKIKENSIDIEVIIITAFGSVDSAVSAMRNGAYDYIVKPFDLDELTLKLKKIEHIKSLKKENTALKAIVDHGKDVFILAESQKMKDVLDLVESIKDSDCRFLITGESGVGKSLVARLAHFSSKRQNMPFISLNCATLTDELLNSELFGHEAGAFTGATKVKKGLVEIADTGTLFLDEIGELSPGVQAKILKVIEDGEFYRVGGLKPIRVDVRFIAATNRDITAFVEAGKFRKDLYYRLNVMEIQIPPLRVRADDILPLANYFLYKNLPKYGKTVEGFTEKADAILLKYDYPGNVRELENIIERAIILEKTSLITLDYMPWKALSVAKEETKHDEAIKSIDDFTKDYAIDVLNRLGGNKTKAAEVLGISRTSLWKIVKE
ncbi:MAG: sigma-54-dependent Fis family transcriptional regulator [Nitrospirae bacterium]|nr:sigma-54-dependent Fis family transcriptional regulator [Nitrospirota bacterium]MBF0536515.1 sigma-54-dependent Fis family transcriptional regulator [Nitrospirota bacterium]MBF0617833.1 sigma-54-dependent Fis family transcriptional regulator [Nitrospirota bacterium]